MSTKLKEAQDKVRELSLKALGIAEATDLTAAEQKSKLDEIEPDIKKWTEEVQALEYVAKQRKKFEAATGQDVERAAAEKDATVGKSIGQQFVESAGYKGLVERGMKGNWSTGDIEIKATLTEGTAGAPGGAYEVANQPNYLPGVVDIRFAPLLVADLFPQGTTSSPLIRYLVETAVTNAAATVAEGGTKPESALTFSKVDETLHKLATFLPISDEMLEDWAQAQSYIDARLTLFVKQAEETQLLRGDGSGSNVVGILNRTGLAPAVTIGTAPSAADDNAMDAIYRQITQIRTTAFLEPDAIVADPTSWEGITLSKNSMGAYYANGPFMSQDTPSLWGKRVAVTPAMDASTALVGAFSQGAQIFRKGGITVEASNSHADFFQKNLTALRAEERLGLAVYRPGAFGTVALTPAAGA